MTSARLYHCARCQSQVVICSDCDRGNIYCGSTCSQLARTQSHRIANQTYQAHLRGKQSNAARQRRDRERERNKVTDQGSTPDQLNDLMTAFNNSKQNPAKERSSFEFHCHFCGKRCCGPLRAGFAVVETMPF
jgi:hypothetical protein